MSSVPSQEGPCHLCGKDITTTPSMCEGFWKKISYLPQDLLICSNTQVTVLSALQVTYRALPPPDKNKGTSQCRGAVSFIIIVYLLIIV